MPRRAAANRREVQPDAVYNNRLVTQLINKVLLDGKKATAERIVYTAFEIVALDRQLLPRSQGEDHGRASRQRDSRRFQRPGRFRQEA